MDSWIRPSVIYYPLFRTIFRFPWEFEIAGFSSIDNRAHRKRSFILILVLLCATARSNNKNFWNRILPPLLKSVFALLRLSFNNMRTLKFKAQPTNAFFASVNQVFGGSSQFHKQVVMAVRIIGVRPSEIYRYNTPAFPWYISSISIMNFSILWWILVLMNFSILSSIVI